MLSSAASNRGLAGTRGPPSELLVRAADRPVMRTRREFLRRTGYAAGIAAAGWGVEGILAARQAPAYAPGTSLHVLMWRNFSPPADVEIVRQATEWGKQQRVTVKVEQVDANDIPPRAAAALATKQGPDILQFIHNWQNQYADALVDVTDLCTALESRYGPYLEYAKTEALLNGRFTAVPHTAYSSVHVVRKSYLKAAGTTRWPKTWDDLRREGKKWKAAGHPIGQTLGHTWGDAVEFVYGYLWSFGAAERDERGRVIIGSKQTLEAVKFFKAFWDDAMDPAGVGWVDSSNNAAFLSGAIAATRNSPSIYLTAMNQAILDANGQLLVNDIDHMPNPAGPAGVVSCNNVQSLAIPKYSKNIEAAKDFIRWLMEADRLSRYLQRSQAYHSGALKMYLNDAMWDMFPMFRPYRDALTSAHYPGWRGPADAKAARVLLDYVLVDMLAHVASGRMSAESSLKWAEGKLKGIYGT
jgi:multiple sugar transport system substrate-binding protein